MSVIRGLPLAFLLVAVLFLSGCVSQQLSGNIVKAGETKLVTKVIDGDTVIVEGGDSVRLLGMDTDEKGYPCFTQAKDRMEELVLNKKVYLEPDGEDKDQYGRYLRYVFVSGENVDLIMVEEGLAVARLSPENTKYKDEIVATEKEAMENGVGCKWGAGPETEQATQTQQLPSKPKESVKWTKLTGNAIDACTAGNYVGQEKIVEGKVVDGNAGSSNTVFLNFGEKYPNQCFTAVIFSSSLGKFPVNPQTYYEGKTARVSGKIKNYQGKPEIVLEEASQIDTGE